MAESAARTVAGLLLASVLLGSALAHGTFVFGSVTTEPSTPRPNEPFTLWLEMEGPNGAAIEDAMVFVEAAPVRAEGPATGEPAEGLPNPATSTEPFQETEPGRYRGKLLLPEAGGWTLLFRDQTFRQEEARASVLLEVGGGASGQPLSFVFPPTATGGGGLTVWLTALIGVPLLAGLVVTMLVLRRNVEDEGDDPVDPERD